MTSHHVPLTYRFVLSDTLIPITYMHGLMHSGVVLELGDKLAKPINSCLWFRMIFFLNKIDFLFTLLCRCSSWAPIVHSGLRPAIDFPQRNKHAESQEFIPKKALFR